MAEPQDYRFEHQLSSLPFVTGKVTRSSDTTYRLIVDEASTAMPALLDWLRDQDIAVESVEEYMPPFDDVFVHLMEGQKNNAA
jgi:hypothetical protein